MSFLINVNYEWSDCRDNSVSENVAQFDWFIPTGDLSVTTVVLLILTATMVSEFLNQTGGKYSGTGGSLSQSSK
jgi:hypothetical protein